MLDLSSEPTGDAVFDMDGTLILGDIAESVMLQRLADGVLPAAVAAALGVDPAHWTAEDVWHRYERQTREDPEGSIRSSAQMIAGMTEEACAQQVDRAFAEGRVRPHAPVCELAAALALHHRVWILSASPEVLAVAVGKRLGISRVIGVRLVQAGGRFTEEILEPLPFFHGKPIVCQREIAPVPLFAIGDSPWDLPLLRTAKVARTTGRIANQEFPML